jgi:hypothetical protein
MEGVINVAEAFGAAPSSLYLASLAYQTADAGILGSQAPAMILDNGNVDPDELFSIPLEALRDEDANGTYDRLEPGIGFVVTASGRTGNNFGVSWNCFPGRSYKIQTSETLAGGSWTDVAGATFTAGASDMNASLSLALNPADSKRFFRVVLIP